MMMSSERAAVDLNSLGDIVAVTELREQLASLQKQLTAKDKQLLSKEKQVYKHSCLMIIKCYHKRKSFILVLYIIIVKGNQ